MTGFLSHLEGGWLSILDEGSLALMMGIVLDLFIGDPHGLYHPVRLVGHLIQGLEKLLRRIFPKKALAERIAGCFLAALVCMITCLSAGLLLLLARRFGPLSSLLLEAWMCFRLLAGKSLRDESRKVYLELKKGDLPAARKALSMIVGRDTDRLDEGGVIRAAVETVAENTSDGVISPLFYLALGGPVLGWFYKAVNTMDSMVGYRNDRYRYFGSAAARLDDVLGFFPARIGALIMIAAAGFGLDRKNALRIFLRDRKRSKSPNAGQTESVMAGALDVQLLGDAYYFGILMKKETVGDPIREAEAEDIVRADRLMLGTGLLAALLFLALRILFLKLLCR